MNLDGSSGRPGNRRNVTRRRSNRTTSSTSPVISPDRDSDLRRRFEALKGDLTASKPNANSPGGDNVGQKVPLTLADIQGSIAKKHTTDLANAQRKWIESLNLQSPVDTGPSEEDAQKEWINHISVSKISDRPSRRDDGQRRRSDRSLSSEYRVNVTSPRSNGATSPQKVPRNLTVRSTVLTPAAPYFGFCDVPHLTINSLPVTATSVKDFVKPDKEFVTESGKTIKMLKLEEPPKPEKKIKGKSPQKMKAVIDLDPSKNEVVRYEQNGIVLTVKSSCSSRDLVRGITVQINHEGRAKPQREKRHFRTSLSPKKLRANEGQTLVTGTLSPDALEKYKLSITRSTFHAKDGTSKTRSKSEYKSPKKLKRSSSLPGGLFKEKLDQEAASKHARTYDVKETRCFIKQKQKEREERSAEERRRKAIEAEERKNKMQQLRETQRKIMQKIKKRTVNKIRQSLDKPKWVGPLENSAPSVLQSSFEFTVPKPKTPVLSNDATGTITFKRPKEPVPLAAENESKTPVDAMRENDPVQQHATTVCAQTDQEPLFDTSSSNTIFKDFCLKDLEVSTDQPLQLKRPAKLVESATQIDLSSEKTPIKTRSVAVSTHHHSKRPKQNLQERLVDKENLGTNVVNANSHYASRFDQFLADYVPTPKKCEGTGSRPKTPPWLQEMSQYPDQFNLINTLNKAYRRQQKLESSRSPIPKEYSSLSSSMPGSSKIHEIGCSAGSRGFSQDSTPVHSEQSAHSNSSSRISEFLLEAPAVKLTDVMSSSNMSTRAHSFEAFPLNSDNNGMKLSAPQTPRLTIGDMNSTDLNFMFPSRFSESRESTLVDPSSNKISCGEFLGEKIPLPKGQITERKPLEHRTKVLEQNEIALLRPLDVSLDPFSTFVNTKRGSDVDLHVAPSSSETGHSRSTSFSSMKEGSYILTHSETKSDNSVKNFDIMPDPGLPRLSRLVPQSALSEHSSDSVSEIVKVSRTVSRGSTVISEEVSEVQNTVSVSKMKFNSSSIQSKIRSEIEQLDRVDESLTSFMESGKIMSTGDIAHSTLNASEPTLEPTSQDLVTVRLKSPLPVDDADNSTVSRLAVARSICHSRDPSNSSLDISSHSVNGADITKFSVELYDKLIKDEKVRSDKFVSSLKVSMKGLWGQAKKDLESIETRRKTLIENGHEEEARELKRKQRGYIMKLNEEIEEMQRQRALEIKACQERCMLLKQQQQIIKLLLQTRRESSARNSRGSVKSLQSVHMDEPVKYLGGERNSDLIDRKKREYREKEEALRERKKNVEAIVAWKKRLEQEEKSVRDLEKLIAQSTFSAPLPEITSSAVERGTSPFTVAKDDEEKAPESRNRLGTISQSESDHQIKDYYSDSFEHSSALSEAAGSALPGPGQGSSLLNKAMKMPMLKVPLSPRVTIIKRRHSSGSDESMLLSQNDTLSEPSDVEVRVSALEQQLRHRKSELAKLKREYQKNQKERLRTTEKSLINQIQLYDSYIEQVKNEIKDLENSDVKVTKPQIKQPKFSDRRQSDKFVSITRSKESQDGGSDAKNNETAASEDMSSQDASVLFLDKPQEQKLPEFQKADSVCETEKMEVATDSNVQEHIGSELGDFEALSNLEISGFTTDPALKTAMEKVRMKAMEPSKDSESSTSEKDFSIEEIIEKAEQSKMDSSEEILTQSNIVTEASMSDIATDHKSKLSAVEELTEIATNSQISEGLSVEGSLTKSDVTSVIEEDTAEPIYNTEQTTEKLDSISTHLQPTTDQNVEQQSVTAAFDAMLAQNDSDLAREGNSNSDMKPDLNTTFEVLKNKVVDSEESKILSEEISEHLVQSKTSSNETVINTVSESARKELFAHKFHSEKNGSTISEKLSMDNGTQSQLVLEQIDDVSPENITNSLSPVVASLSPPSISPQKSVENGSEQVSERISNSAKFSEDVKSSAQSISEQVASSEAQEVSNESGPQTKSSSSGTIQEELSGASENSLTAESLQEVVESPPLNTSVSPEPTKLSQEHTVSAATSAHSGATASKSARKRLDMDAGDLASISTSKRESNEASTGYVPTMQIEGGRRSISELIHSDTISEGSSVSEQILTDQTGTGVVEETASEKSSLKSESLQQIEEVFESEKNADDSVLDKLDFSLGSLAAYKPVAIHKGSPSQSEAGDNITVSQHAELPEDKEELGQGDEPGREIELGEMEADSLEDPFKGFDTSYNPEEFAEFFDSSFNKEPEVSPLKPPSGATVMQLLQTSCQIADKIWENDLAEMKGKSSEDTPLLSALQRESQQNFNVDSISKLILDSFVEDATSAALTAYAKKKLSSPETSPESKNLIDAGLPQKVGDNEKLWLGEDFTLQAAHEAEQLRLQQLQIEQEIEQLEQAQEVVPSYYYVREIPNKPPPPYTPPKPAPPSKEETISRVLQGGEILWDLEMTGGDPSAAAIPSNYLSNLQDDPYRMFLFDLTKELYLKVKPRPPEPTPPWVVSEPRGKPRPPIRCKEDLLKHMEKEAKLAFGFEPRILRESLIMKWTRKRRDNVDEILVRELQESEAEWRDFTVEENIIKNRVAESIMAESLDEAADALALAFANKFKNLTVQQS